MVCRGQVKDGVVVFAEAPPPDGSVVRVEVVAAEAAAAPEAGATVWEKLRRYSGAVSDLPPDMARNHDHYIHGAPKK